MLASCQCLVILQVTPHHLQPHPHTHPSTPTSRPLLPPLPAAFISLSRLPGRRDLAHCRQTFLPFAIFKSVHCILLQVLKDRSPSLSCFYFSRRVSQPPSLSNKMSPHKMNNKSLEARRVSDFLSGADVLNSGLREREKNCLLHGLAVTLCLPPSGVSIPERRIYLVNINTHFFGPAWKLDPSRPS